ncbi:MAG TPA: DUF4870 domain-containing protein [Homoserinimonas sp.]|nr:DUF4870 domain-containing protein [Homoserinimonas sp.]
MTNSAPPPPGEYHPVQPMSPSDEKLWSTLVHVGGIFIGVFASLIGYLVLKDRGPFVRAHTQAALNFQITMAIATVVGIITTFILIGFVILMAVGIVIIVFSIIAAMKANNGEYYTYPLSIPLIK